MAAPSYVNISNFVKGVGAAQAALNVESHSQTWDNPKAFILDRYAGRTGWAEDFDLSSTITVSGETNTTVALSGGAAWGAALTMANVDAATFTVTGGAYMDSVTVDKSRDGFQTMTMNCTAINGIT